MTKTQKLLLVIPSVFTLLSGGLLLTGFSQGIEYGIYDLFLMARPAPPQNKDIVLVEMDDPSISTIGTWPISRSIMADILLLMRELGTQYAVFDIEYVNKSPRGVNSEVLTHDIPDALDSATGNIELQVQGLFDAITSGQLSLGDARGYIGDLVDLIQANRDMVKEEFAKVILDNDIYLAQAVRAFGNAYLTVNMQDFEDNAVAEADRQSAMGLHSRASSITDRTGQSSKTEIVPVISPILESAKGLGFTNVDIDDDGVRRRVKLFQRYKDAWFAQLATSPLLDMLGKPKVELSDRGIRFEGAHMPDGTTRNIFIPYSTGNTVLIDWPHTKYEDSFRHVSMGRIYVHNKFYDDLVSNLRQRETWGYLQLYQGETPLLELADQAARLREAILEGQEDPALMDSLRQIKDRFLTETGTFLASRPENEITGQLEALLASGELTESDAAQFRTILQDAPAYFSKTRSIYDGLMKQRAELAASLEGSFAILGQTNTGSTDIGANPFQKDYRNVGTHASVVNMILNNSFVREMSPWWSLLVSLLVGTGLLWFSRSLNSVPAILWGTGVSALTVLVFLVIFTFTGAYFAVFTMALPIALSFITATFFKFMVAEQEKGFLRSAFSHYLSDAVIRQIVADPSRLQLGGQQKYMTAMFTDIKGFSTISEKLTPTELVALLNRYLTRMSDLVLDAGGTIDKYEGDAIIAFFGAPLDLADHARLACLTAVRMKRAESELNEQFMAEGVAPNPLLTRIGINSGDMVVGNMGTVKKMDYTIIGDSVNLAARLEGVNKQYGTWICVSEDTVRNCGDSIVFRRLDRIRVVGKSVPIRIYDALEEPDHLTETTKAMLPLFEEGLDLFESRKWTEAAARFKVCLELVPGDGPSQRYLRKCTEFETTPPPEKWDGIFSLDMK